MSFLKYLFLLVVFANFAHAGSSADKDIVYAKMKEYADLVACHHSFKKSDDTPNTTLSDVFLIEQDKTTADYYVLWGGDLGCFGGSTSVGSFVSHVYKKDGQFYIVDNFAFGDIDLEYRFIEDIRQISNKEFIITSWDYADDRFGGQDGGINIPANKFEYTVERSGKYNPWVITRAKLIEQRQGNLVNYDDYDELQRIVSDVNSAAQKALAEMGLSAIPDNK